MNESILRRKVATRIAYAGADFVRAGVVTLERFQSHASLVGAPLLPVRQGHWVRFQGSKGEIDISVPQFGIAVECKLRGSRVRLNWEEALGQALRDRELPWVQYAYIAVPEAEVTDWMLRSTRTHGVGVITVAPRADILETVFRSHASGCSLE